jgi:hypothetical protein
MPVLEGRSMTTKVLAVAAIVALAWVTFQTTSVPTAALSALAGNTALLGGLAVLALFAYFAASEAEDDDGVEDVIRKTGDRASNATGGFLDAASATVLALAAVAMTVGMQLVEALGSTADLIASAPLVATNLAAGGLGIGAAMGLLGTEGVIVGVLALVVVGVALRRRGE